MNVSLAVLYRKTRHQFTADANRDVPRVATILYLPAEGFGASYSRSQVQQPLVTRSQRHLSRPSSNSASGSSTNAGCFLSKRTATPNGAATARHREDRFRSHQKIPGRHIGRESRPLEMPHVPKAPPHCCRPRLHASTAVLAHAQDSGPYKVLKIQLVGGDGGFDYVTADSDGRNLYVARSGPGGHIGVFNLDTLAQVGDIPDASGHGARWTRLRDMDSRPRSR